MIFWAYFDLFWLLNQLKQAAHLKCCPFWKCIFKARLVAGRMCYARRAITSRNGYCFQIAVTEMHYNNCITLYDIAKRLCITAGALIQCSAVQNNASITIAKKGKCSTVVYSNALSMHNHWAT